jgi:hypothetical protein
VTDQSGPLPQRIGDAERDRAAEFLREHLAEGRLDQLEFDERLTQALTARTQADLEPLFRDLPGPKPGQPSARGGSFPAPPWQQPSNAVSARPVARVPAQRNNAWQVAAGVAWPVVILAIIAMEGGALWWLISIPIIISMIAKQSQQPGPPRR